MLDMRFWKKVNFQGPIHPDPSIGQCWLWTASISNVGYGQFGYEGKLELAHRVIKGLPELDVLHRCDVRNCIRPDHLFIGTQQDNAWDAAKKGRFSQAKLTEKKVKAVRHMFALGFTANELGRIYGMHPATVYKCVHRRTYKWVE